MFLVVDGVRVVPVHVVCVDVFAVLLLLLVVVLPPRCCSGCSSCSSSSCCCCSCFLVVVVALSSGCCCCLLLLCGFLFFVFLASVNVTVVLFEKTKASTTACKSKLLQTTKRVGGRSGSQ